MIHDDGRHEAAALRAMRPPLPARSLRPALDGVEGVFLLPGYADMPGVLAEARRAGVSRAVQLSGMSAGSGDMSNAITRYMTESEQAVRDSGLDWTILRPAAFMSNMLQWVPRLRAGDVVRAPFARVRAAVIDPADIAVAATALTAHGQGGRVYALSGPEALAPADRVQILGPRWAGSCDSRRRATGGRRRTPPRSGKRGA
jgi:uncharacterized protein YbjT (DUF2867 family)